MEEEEEEGKEEEGKRCQEKETKVYAGTGKHSTTTKERGETGEIRMIYSYLLANYQTNPLPQIQSTVPGYDESETGSRKTHYRPSGGGNKHGPGLPRRARAARLVQAE